MATGWGGARWSSLTVDNNCSIVSCSDNNNPNPASPPGGELRKSINQIKFDIDDGSPFFNISTSFLTFPTTQSGTTSTELQYTLSGKNLSPANGNVIITPPANFQISLSQGGPYSASPISIAYTEGDIAEANVYVVFTPTNPLVVYNQQITHTGGEAPPIGINVNGVSSCGPVTSLNENFDSYTTTTFPLCWTNLSSNPSNVRLNSSSASSSPNCLSLLSSSASDYGMVKLPELSNLGTGTHQLRFKMKASQIGDNELRVGYLTNPY